MGKAKWGGNPVSWWLGLYFCLVCGLDEASCTVCYWWLGVAGSCIQGVFSVWVLTILYSLVLVLWLSRVLESVLPLQRLRALSLSKDQSRSNLPTGISPKMKGPLLEFQKPVHKSRMKISDSAKPRYCLPHGQTLGCNRWLEDLSLAVLFHLFLLFHLLCRSFLVW